MRRKRHVLAAFCDASPLVLVVIALPCALLGGKLRERQLQARA